MGRKVSAAALAFLTWKRAATYSGFVAIAFTLLWAYSIFSGTPPVTRGGDPIPGDYLAFYTAARLVLSGDSGAMYDPERVRAIQAQLTEFRIPGLYDPMRNPAFVALALAPLAVVDLLPSFAVWTLLNAGCIAAAVWLTLKTLPQLRAHWRAIAIVLVSFEPVYRGLVGGQNEGISLLLYVLCYRAMRAGREPIAGAWAALGLFKPQLFLVFPIVFWASRRRRALAGYAITAAILSATTLAMIGVDGLSAWMRVIIEHEPANVVKNSYRMHSLKGFFDLLLPGQPGVALGLSVLTSAAALILLVSVWRRDESWNDRLAMRWALTSVIAVLLDPHLLDYDLAVLVLAGLLIGVASPTGRWWVLVFYLALLGTLLFDVKPIGDVQVQLSVPLMVVFVGWAWRSLRTDVARGDLSLQLQPVMFGLPRLGGHS